MGPSSWSPGAPRQELAQDCPHPPPFLLSPSARGGAPHWWSSLHGEPPGSAEPPRDNGGGSIEAKSAILGRSGVLGPLGPPLCVLPSREDSPPRCPSLASGPTCSVLCSQLFWAGSPSPGRELAMAVRGCCSNEKSEQLNRKIWIKKLEFNIHAPHLLKH